jgi:hypothetical protein
MNVFGAPDLVKFEPVPTEREKFIVLPLGPHKSLPSRLKIRSEVFYGNFSSVYHG